MKTIRLAAGLAVAALIAGAAHAATASSVAPAASGAPEEKWQITTKMEMTGMPFAMPATTQNVCIPPGQANEKMVPADSKCKVSGLKVTGNTTRFHVECPAPQQMSGDGEFTRQGVDAYSGTMTMKGVMEGQQREMKMTYAGKKLGLCDAEKDKMISAKGIMAEQQRATAQSCGELAKGMSWQVAPQMTQMCPTLKADICKSAKTLLDGAKNSDGFLDAQEKRQDWKDLAGYCGIDTNALASKYCALAKKEQNWNNASVICGEDPELEAMAKQQCTGKMYTAGLIEDKYQSLCARYADRIDPGKPSKEERAAKKAADRAKMKDEGIKVLKGLLGH